jgi:GT2 family glycosyltransferase
MSEAPLVCVVVLNYNGLPDVLRCLKKVLASSYLPLSVVLVDNGSTDSSVQEIRTCFPDITVLTTVENLGYGGGNNLGILEALRIKAEYILLLSHDTEVAQDMISSLVASFNEDKRVGIVSPKILLPGPDRRLWAVGGVLRDQRVITWGVDTVDSESNDFGKLDFVFGCAMMLRRSVLEQIGLLDVGFHFYFEDIDLCLRAKHAGYDVAWVPGAEMRHLTPMAMQGSSRFKIHNYERSRFIFYRKYSGKTGWPRFAIHQVAHALRIICRYLGQGRLRPAYWSMTGMVAGALAREHPEQRV